MDLSLYKPHTVQRRILSDTKGKSRYPTATGPIINCHAVAQGHPPHPPYLHSSGGKLMHAIGTRAQQQLQCCCPRLHPISPTDLPKVVNNALVQGTSAVTVQLQISCEGPPRPYPSAHLHPLGLKEREASVLGGVELG
jgi:hypothetical protein